MPRLRYFSSDVLEQLQPISAQNPDEDAIRKEQLVGLFKRAARYVLDPDLLSELLWELHAEPTLRELAVRRASSPATEFRQRREKRPSQMQRLGKAVIAVQLAEGLQSQDGLTIDPRTGMTLKYRTGCLVSVKRYGRCFRRRPSIASIMRWLSEHAMCLSSHFPGSWRSSTTGASWLDMNRWIPTQAEALAIGAAEGQEAIFDLQQKCAIRVACPATKKVA